MFEETIKDTPKYTCSVCQLLCFKKDIRAFKNKQKETYRKLVKSFDNLLTYSICQNFHTSLKHSIVPKYATPHNIKMNNPLQYVQQLTKLEEHLVSLQIAFAQIWELGYKRSQVGLIGSIINVPVNTKIIQITLPVSTNTTNNNCCVPEKTH